MKIVYTLGSLVYNLGDTTHSLKNIGEKRNNHRQYGPTTETTTVLRNKHPSRLR